MSQSALTSIEKTGPAITKNLRGFLDLLKREGELQIISREVDPELEITEINDRVVKKGGPALFFEKVRGSCYPLAINLFGSLRRMNLALGVDSLESISSRIADFIEMKAPETFWEKIKALPKIQAFGQMVPRLVSQAPCQEVVETEGPLLESLPIIKCWPEDGGRFITYPLVITKDPETGRRNVGLYRMHVYDSRTTGMHWQIHKDGAEHYRKLKEQGAKKIEVACVLGADPITLFSSACPLPRGIDELLFAGFLRKRPVEMVRAKTVDLEVPAEAEFVLEGTVDLEERRLEGPFGDHNGVYSAAKEFPVFRLNALTRRKDPIYMTTVVGRPPMEDAFLGKAIERIFLPLIRTQLPEIVDLHLPVEGVFHNCVLVSIKKRYPQHAKKVISALWGFGQLMFSKMVFVFDHDVNVEEPQDFLWRSFTYVDPKRDIVFSEGPLDELDFSSSHELYGWKMGVDATRKWREEGMERPWPPDIVMTEEVKKKVTERWRDYGLNESDA